MVTVPILAMWSYIVVKVTILKVYFSGESIAVRNKQDFCLPDGTKIQVRSCYT